MADWALTIAAITLAQEARGEPIEGQVAVAHVMVNRRSDGRWGKTLASVCLWPHQFSGWASASDPNFSYACNLGDDDPVLVHMRSIVQGAMFAEEDPTHGALFYYAQSIPKAPAWAGTMKQCGKFGHQFFFTDKEALFQRGVA